MKGLSQKQLKNQMEKISSGKFVNLNGEDFYKIENYDCMTDFFMTITSSSDVWNTLWSQGGISAGRKDCNHAIFPYYTADKIADAKSYTGSCTAILVECEEKSGNTSKNDEKNGEEKDVGHETFVWLPFTESSSENYSLQRNLYKNTSGSKVYFEEINLDFGLCFRYGWTSGEKYGLIKHSIISAAKKAADLEASKSSENTESIPSIKKIRILDGCRNILPACVDADFQNKRSVLLDAYKKTDYDADSELTLFSVSSVVTDRAEPSEGLYANTCWFTDKGNIFIDPQSFDDFILGKQISQIKNLKGKRASCMQLHELEYSDLENAVEWYQVFDSWLDTSKVLSLQKKLRENRENKAFIIEDLEQDIQNNLKNLEELIAQSDGIQDTNDKTMCIHHKANVLFNIMRGGILADEGKIAVNDFIDFIKTRNNAYTYTVKTMLEKHGEMILPNELYNLIEKSGNPQIERLYLEYVPLIFSRRHGDPSRPWNFFSIKLKDDKGNRSYNYEGNWRDIFQNWEALCLSYPEYTKNFIEKFLSAMTIDGFNPYRISRDGIDWEIPDPTDPWSNIGYWNDHQVIYLQKLLEFQYKISPKIIFEFMNKKLFSTANIPYRLKEYKEILKNPRDTISFDSALSRRLLELSAKQGTDAKLVCSNFDATKVEQVSMLTKMLQIILAKLANFIPGGGIWLNTQRPEWNDANNALAGYGLSVVTVNYLYRMIRFFHEILQKSPIVFYLLPEETAVMFAQMSRLYSETAPELLLDWTDEESCKNRKAFVDSQELYFEQERKCLYENGHSKKEAEISKDDLIRGLEAFENHIEKTIWKNQRDDGLFHTYNTLVVMQDKMEIHGLTLMLEGQVAVLSSGILDCTQAARLCDAMKKSSLYVADRNTYILYPDRELPDFWQKNNFEYSELSDFEAAKKMIENRDTRIICRDENGLCHFNSDFRNADLLKQAIDSIRQEDSCLLSSDDEKRFEALYEKVFHHASFTGRSGTFYAYEGLGSVYWHMVSKYLVAVQEYVLKANSESKEKEHLVSAYYDIRSGLGFNKTPAEYGAFPTDPYSHTPKGQGAKQPGMTGQVKEEIITRWGELGLKIDEGRLCFAPTFLKDDEYDSTGSLRFTAFGRQFEYKKDNGSTDGKIENNVSTDRAFIEVEYSDNKKKRLEGTVLDYEISQRLFERSDRIKKVTVQFCVCNKRVQF